jgi:hypothetical protein
MVFINALSAAIETIASPSHGHQRIPPPDAAAGSGSKTGENVLEFGRIIGAKNTI